MKRLDVLQLTGCNQKRFEGYHYRKQLPFYLSTDDSRVKTRATYSLEKVFALGVMMESVDDAGLDLEAAKYVASNAVRKLRSASEKIDNDEDLWLILLQDRENSLGFPARTLVAGTLRMLPELIQQNADEESLRRIVMVNASSVSRAIKANAEEHDISEGKVDGPAWGAWVYADDDDLDPQAEA